MSTNKPGQGEAPSGSKPDDMIKPKSKDGKITLSEKELGGVTGGKRLTQVKYEGEAATAPKHITQIKY
jgi:hypothetical protein